MKHEWYLLFSGWFEDFHVAWNILINNKANLRDLIPATGLLIWLKFDPNHRFFSRCDLEIWCMTSKNNRAPLLYHIKLCVSFQIQIQTEVTLRKRSIRVKIVDFLSLVTLKFDGFPWKTIGHLFYTTSGLVHHFKSIGELKLKLQSGNAQFGSKSAILCPVWRWNLMDDLGKNTTPLLYYTNLCASFQIYRWIQIWVTVRKRSIWVKIGNFLACVTLKFDGWPWKQ